MGYKTKLQQLIKRHAKDEKGSMATIFSVSMMTVAVAVGTTFDVNQIQSSASRAQQVADIVGLTATVYVKHHGTPPTSDDQGFIHGKAYSAKEMGFNMGPASQGNSDVTFRVYYDEEKAQAVVKMDGKLQTSFMGVVGQEYLSFENEAIVKYAESENGDPASIFLVIDNSGSMAWHDKRKTNRWASSPSGAKPRITGAKTEINRFNVYLKDMIEEKTGKGSDEFIRMGMTAYSSGILNHRTVSPRWGTIPTSKVNNMIASGGTYPDSAVRKVENWMKNEDKKHEAKNGSKKPLKYVIFMTDGVNSSSYTETMTLQSCSRMKAQDIQVYTIGFALEPGYYRAYYDWQNSYMSAYYSAKAYRFLQDCASSPDHFIKAEDASKLNDAFDKIGEDIITDVVRVAS